MRHKRTRLHVLDDIEPIHEHDSVVGLKSVTEWESDDLLLSVALADIQCLPQQMGRVTLCKHLLPTHNATHTSPTSGMCLLPARHGCLDAMWIIQLLWAHVSQMSFIVLMNQIHAAGELTWLQPGEAAGRLG